MDLDLITHILNFMNCMIYCFSGRGGTVQERSQRGQHWHSSCLVGGLRQGHGVLRVLLYSLGSPKFGSRCWCGVTGFPPWSLLAVLGYSSILKCP